LHLTDVLSDALVSKFEPPAIAAFQKLCELGCDSAELNLLLTLIATDKVLLHADTISRPDGEQVTLPERTISLHSLDDRTKEKRGKKFGGEQRLGGFTLEELRKIARDAEQLLEKITRLRSTDVVQDLRPKGQFKRGDLLAGHPQFHSPDHRFAGIMALPDLVKKSYTRRNPDRDELRITFAKYVKKQTGDDQDSLRADILRCIVPNDPKRPISSKGEYAFRKRHRIAT